MMQPDLARHADALAAAGEPYVVATVVRAQRPSSVTAGDCALILAGGVIEGFVGGECAESSVRLHALRVLETGEALVLRILPGDEDGPKQEGAVNVHNPCLSGGALEIFLEPRMPAPRIAVVGETPIAKALASLAAGLGYAIDDAPGDRQAAAVVASHGHDEVDALAKAFDAGVPYVGLVASRRRGSAVVEALADHGLGEHDRARVHTPAGLDIGARTPGEIALSILAEIVAERRARHTFPLPGGTATDPVCGMTVTAADPSPHAEYGGRTVWFCGDGCRQAFEAEADRYVAAL